MVAASLSTTEFIKKAKKAGNMEVGKKGKKNGAVIESPLPTIAMGALAATVLVVEDSEETEPITISRPANSLLFPKKDRPDWLMSDIIDSMLVSGPHCPPASTGQPTSGASSPSTRRSPPPLTVSTSRRRSWRTY